MPEFLVSILAFVVAISVLVAVHEYGHYCVARALGFKVLRYSIGFGRPLVTWRGRDADEIEYWISAIPLGGYVKMLDEREGPVARTSRKRSAAPGSMCIQCTAGASSTPGPCRTLPFAS